MNLYAIYDRMIDYFMPPFIGPSDNQVKASLAEAVNNQETKSALTTNPHHFEIWRLAEIEETGEVKPSKEYLADAASLVRERVRSTGKPGADQDQTPPGPSTRTPSGDRVRPGTPASAAQITSHSASLEGQEAGQGPTGVPGPVNLTQNPFRLPKQ